MAQKTTEFDLQFPLEGIDQTRSFTRQRAGTTIDARNVRSFEPSTNRARGCNRAGMVRYFPGLAVTTTLPVTGGADTNVYPIQDINHLVSTELAPVSDYGRFSFAYPVAAYPLSGTGIGNGSSGSILFANLGAAADFQFANSCWDDDGNLYVAEVNQTTGAVSIRCIDSDGAITWTNSSLSCATGSARNVAGMVVIGTKLFIGLTTIASYVSLSTASCRIVRMSTTNGSIASGDGTWRLTSTSFLLMFSSASQNAFAAIGNTLFYEAYYPGTGGYIIAVDATSPAGVTYLGAAVHGGTNNHSKTRVVTDGTFIYVITNSTTQMIQKYTAGLVAVWPAASSAADTVKDITYDKKSGQLVALASTTPYVRMLNLSTGVQVTSSTANDIAWDTLDCDSNGTFILMRNSVASGDAMAMSSTFYGGAFGIVWGPSTLANAVHSGTSVNKGNAGIPPAAGARQIRPLLVAGGQGRGFTSSGTTALTGGQCFSATAPVIFSAQNGLNMFYVDGSSYSYYKASTNSFVPWVADTPGTVPFDSPVPTAARLITTWNGRTVLAGYRSNPQMWFMSAQFNPFNWNYSPSTTTLTQATNGNVSDAGLVGDFITCLIPYTNDVLIVGCDHTIWQLKGDPMAGGRFDRVSDSIGMAWGRPYAIDPFGQIYFMAQTGGIFKLTPGALPIPVSQQIEKKLNNINMATNIIRMAYDIQLHGLAVWVTPLDRTKATQNYFFEERTNSWWVDTYTNPAHNPMAVHVYDGDSPQDRRIMMGGSDGYVRIMSDTATTDDGTAISSYVWLGPMSTKQMDDIMLHDLQATLGDSSGTVKFEVYVGPTVEAAMASTAAVTGNWMAGRNRVSFVQRSGFVAFVKLSSTSAWALERIMARYTPLGEVRRRL